MAKPVRHAGGVVRRTQYGTWSAEYSHAGQRLRQTHKSLEAAKAWLDQKAAEASMMLEPTTPGDMADADAARRILAGRCTLVEAARLWEKSQGQLSVITVKDAVQTYLYLRDGDNLRPRSLESWRHRLNRLVKHYPDRPLHTITTEDLRAVQSGSATTRNNLRRYHMTFFDWAKTQHHVLDNPARSLTRSEADETLPQALTVDRVKALLTTATDTEPGMVPWLTLGLFAGLRQGELERITPEHIRGARLHLDPSVTKLRHRRILDMLPTMIAWLEAYPLDGPCILTNHRKRWDALRKAAGITTWPSNGLRHSFCTYHLAAHQDPAKTAHYTRHENQSTLHRHYIDLATHEDGLAYFALTPAAIQNNRPD